MGTVTLPQDVLLHKASASGGTDSASAGSRVSFTPEPPEAAGGSVTPVAQHGPSPLQQQLER